MFTAVFPLSSLTVVILTYIHRLTFMWHGGVVEFQLYLYSNSEKIFLSINVFSGDGLVILFPEE